MSFLSRLFGFPRFARHERTPLRLEPLEPRVLLAGTVPESVIPQRWDDLEHSDFVPAMWGFALGEHGSTFDLASEAMDGAINAALDYLPGVIDGTVEITFSIAVEGEVSYCTGSA